MTASIHFPAFSSSSSSEKVSTMIPHTINSPVMLSYAAALRQVKPRTPGEPFTYFEVCAQPSHLIALAASNPEGRFYGCIHDPAVRTKAEIEAVQRSIPNVVFLAGKPSEILAQVERGSALPPKLNYLSCDESAQKLPELERKAVFSLAEKLLLPSGILNLTYQAFDRKDGALRFLVRDFGPEMNPQQAQSFLQELKTLGQSFLQQNPDIAANLDDAITKNMPDAFFARYDQEPVVSNTLETIIAVGSRDFVFCGDANIPSNYLELSVPPSAQSLIFSLHKHALYEPIKDYALNRKVRSDIWVKMPANLTANEPELFGSFAYGIMMPADKVPMSFAAQGKTIDLSGPLYRKLIELMALLPITVGDFLGHPIGEGADPAKVVEALQIMIACGIVRPMRGQFAPKSLNGVAQPRLVGAYNRYLDRTQVTGEDVILSSSVMGSAVVITSRDALVMQALNRAGLADAVSALYPELQRMVEAGTSHKVMEVAEPTPEAACNMVQDVVGRSIVQWYAFGLLEAA